MSLLHHEVIAIHNKTQVYQQLVIVSLVIFLFFSSLTLILCTNHITKSNLSKSFSIIAKFHSPYRN